MQPYPLLITTALSPPDGVPYLKMGTPLKRKLLTKAAAYFWVAQGIRQIVIADSTNSALFDPHEVNEIRLLGCEIEQILFNQDEDAIKTRGKGFAEGCLIQHSLIHSSILNEATHLYKATGKTFVRNFKEVSQIIAGESLDLIFWLNSQQPDVLLPWVDTRFFFSSTAYLGDKIVPCYLSSNDGIEEFCEAAIFRQVTAICSRGNSTRPLISGYSGGHDDWYFEKSLGNLDSYFPCWFLKQ